MLAELRAVRAVAFDLDGTLVDSAADIGHALNTALAGAGLRRFDLPTIRTWIGDGPDALIARALAAQGFSADDAALRQSLRAGFDAATLAAPLAHGRVFPGIAALLRELNERRYPLAVVTNKPTPLARAVVDAAGLLPWFSQVQGADSAAQRKPSPAMLQATAAQLGVATSHLLMVGDAPPDILAAAAAGCPAALVSWGYGAHAVPAGLDPWRVEHPDQIGERLRSQPPAPAAHAQRG